MNFQSELGNASYPFSIRLEERQHEQRIAPYFVTDGMLYIGVTKQRTPALVAREMTNISDSAGQELWDLPATVPDGEVYEKYDRIVQNCLPSIGTQAESISIDALKVLKAECIPGREFIAAQEILDRSFRGAPVSFALVFSVMSLALENGISLKMPLQPTVKTRGYQHTSVEEKQITKGELEAWRCAEGSKTMLELAPIEPPANPFIKSIAVECADGKVEIAHRKGTDAVDVGSYVWHKGRVFLPVKIGSRPAKLLMDAFSTRPYPWCDINGVAGSVEPGEKDLRHRALVETEEELRMQVAAAPIRIGSFFSLPDGATEKVTEFLCEVTPDLPSTRVQSADETVSLRFMELDELLEASREGLIQDGRFILSALFIKQAFHYHDPYKKADGDLHGHVAILGGTFDPLQNAHCAIANATLASGDAEAVLLLPTKQNRLKNWKPTFADEVRLETVLASISSLPGVYASDLELTLAGDYSITAETVALLKKQNPEATFSFIMGSDLLYSLHQWECVDELFSMLNGVIVYERDGFSYEDFETLEGLLSAEIITELKRGWRSSVMHPHSSTEIRRSLASGRIAAVRQQIPDAVYDYLLKSRTYDTPDR